MLHSDVDFLVTSHLDSFARAHAERLVSREMGGSGIGYDIIYADDVRPECLSEFCDAKLAASDLFELANEIGKFGPGDAKPD